MFRAYDATRERLVAVKVFALDLPPERTHQLVAELERLIAADLTHPALAAPLATGISGVSAFLAQDYVAADSLDLAVREYGPAPIANALRVAAQLAGALDFAAAVQVTHGALHPRDVLLSSDDTRLTGLGITRALHKIGVVAPVRRPYTAPERVAGGDWDRRADVFSLAALMHELIWGKRVSGLGARAADNLTEIPGTRLPALQDVFAQALAENAADRFETALAFAGALKDACPDVTIAPEPPPPAAKRRAAREEAPRLPLEETAVDTVAAAKGPEEIADIVLSPPAAAVEPDVTVTPAETVPAFEIPISTAPVPDIAFRPIVEPVHKAEPAAASPLSSPLTHDPEVVSALERTRSAVWPLVLALGVGIAIGFAGGFFAGSREQPPPAIVAAAVPPPVAVPAEQTSEVRSQKAEVQGEKAHTETQKAATSPKATTGPKSEITPKSEINPLKSQPAEGRLLVRSRPAGARVTVDGKDYGPTPATVRGLAFGAHQVRVLHGGYAPQDRRVVVSSSRPAQSMTVELEATRAAGTPTRGPAPAATETRFVGALAVDSRPTGAKVFVDGTLVGTTPVALPTVAAGSHVIRLEHDGYRRWSSSVRIVASEQNRVTASLER